MDEVLTRWFGGEFTFNGFVRWQLWFDNPNKTAVLFAELAIVGVSLLVRRRSKLCFIGFLVLLASTYSLLRTFSRGGLVSLIVGCSIMYLGIPQRCGKLYLRLTWCLSFCVFIAMVSIGIGFSGRITQGLSGDDKSVGNRLELWSQVPRMIHDAPLGWGWGRSGEAYMQWYQPLERHERYRTLVNSHLTLLVELGVVGGIAWVLCWATLFASGWRLGHQFGSWLCLAEWCTLFAAGVFSSVCESWELWMMPGLVHVVSFVEIPRSRRRFLFDRAGVCFCGFLILVYAMVMLVYMVVGSNSSVCRGVGRIKITNGTPTIWIVPDAAVLGGTLYPREIRAFHQNGGTAGFCIVETAEAIPQDADYVVICGDAKSSNRRGRKKTIWLSPIRKGLMIRKNDLVIVGEFADIQDVRSNNVFMVAGVSDYIPNWPGVVSRFCK